jgi:hypothetical protein
MTTQDRKILEKLTSTQKWNGKFTSDPSSNSCPCYKNPMSTIVLAKIKMEARSWMLAGAKHLGFPLPGD